MKTQFIHSRHCTETFVRLYYWWKMGCSFVIRYISGPQLLFDKKLGISRNWVTKVTGGSTCHLSKQFISLKNANKKLKYGCHSTALNLLYFCMFSPSAWVKCEHFWKKPFFTAFTFAIKRTLYTCIYFPSDTVSTVPSRIRRG